MKSTLFTLSLSTSVCGLAFRPPYQTRIIPVPSEAAIFTTTIPPCGTLPGYVLIANANSTFHPGITTVFVPPQATEATRTFINTEYNLTELVVMLPLPGTCAPKIVDDDTATTNTYTALSQFTATDIFLSPTASAAAACPFDHEVYYSYVANTPAQAVVDGINNATLLSQHLQGVAEQLGAVDASAAASAASAAAAHPVTTISVVTASFLLTTTTTTTTFYSSLATALRLLTGLREIGATLTAVLPALAALPPFAPRTTDTRDISYSDASAAAAGDAVVGALGSFLAAHQTLLNILAGRARLVAAMTVVENDDDDDDYDYDDDVGGWLAAMAREGAGAAGGRSRRGLRREEKERRALGNVLSATIATVLRAVEGVVDQLAYDVVGLVPGRAGCTEGRKEGIDAAFGEAIAAYEA